MRGVKLKKAPMEANRFEKFTLLIDGIHKCMNKIKIDVAPELGVKSVHVFWVYELLLHPEGLTAAEIAAVSMIDRSLVSREIETLQKNGYVTSSAKASKRKYNSVITLTEKGTELARRIEAVARNVQMAVDADISENELVAFYATLEKLFVNFSSITSKEKINIRQADVLAESKT